MAVATARDTFAPACFKERAISRWVSRRLGGIEHERQVVAVATHLFDITQPLHGLGSSDRKLLRLACLAHDVGRSICAEDHPQLGCDMILDDSTLPLSASDRRALAYLTLYHKGKVPEAGRDEILFKDDSHDQLRLILAMLRAADGLDCRKISSPRLVFALAGRRGNHTLRIGCYLEENSAKARKVFSRRKKFRLLEELLGVQTEVRLRSAHALLMVA